MMELDSFNVRDFLSLDGQLTVKEKEILSVAVDMANMNSNLQLKLTGSLMLRLRGYDTRREVGDIDFVCECLDGPIDGLYGIPDGFSIIDKDGTASSLQSVQLKHKETGMKIDIMFSYECGETVSNGKYTMLCGSVGVLLRMKSSFALNDATPGSRSKHTQDVLYFLNNNNFTITL